MRREDLGNLVRETEGSVYVTRCSGTIDDEMAIRMLEGADRLLKTHARITFFVDWEHSPSYDRTARNRLTKWVVQHISNIEMVHFLLTSALLRMGVTVAQLTARMPLVSHAERAIFEAELDKALSAQRASKSDAGPQIPAQKTSKTSL